MPRVSFAKQREHLMIQDPILATLIAQVKLKPFKKAERDHFRTLVQSIVAQQLSDKAATTIINRLIALFPRKIFPAPQDLLRTDTEKLRSVGLSYAKASYIKDLAERVVTKQIHLPSFEAMSDEEVTRELVAVKGIGPWTAEMFLIFSLHREDIFSYGDLGLQNAIWRLYKLKTRPTKKQMERIVQKWRPYRSLAARYLWAGLDSALFKM